MRPRRHSSGRLSPARLTMQPAPKRSRTRAAMAITISRARSLAARCVPPWPRRPEPSEESDMAEIKLAAPVGLPLDRVDGRLKVTGKAPYAYEYAGQSVALCGIIVPASIGKGRVAAVDVREARTAPGVRLVLTKDNAPPQHPFGPVDLPDRFARAVPALNNEDVPFFGFPVAFVIADTFEQATAAATMVRVAYAPGWGAYDLHAAGPTAINPGRITSGDPADSAIGNLDHAFANAPVKIEAIYTTPYQHQAPMEPHATMAAWDGPKLTVHTAAQLTASPQEGLA